MVTLIDIFYYRNATRLVHVPFFRPENETSEIEKREAEELRCALKQASSSIGVLTGLVQQFRMLRIQRLLKEKILPMAVKCLQKMPYRVKKSYALLVTWAHIVNIIFKGVGVQLNVIIV